MKKRTEAAVAAIILDDAGRVLLTQRDRDPKAGIWHLPGGGVEIGENHINALRREVREELGVDIDVPDVPVAVTTRQYPDFDRHVLCVYFKAKITQGVPQPLDATRALQWADEDATQKLIDEGVFLDSCHDALIIGLNWELRCAPDPNPPVWF